MFSIFNKKQSEPSNDDKAESPVDEQEIDKAADEEIVSDIPLSARVGKLPKTMVNKIKEHVSHVRTLRAVVAILVILQLYSMNTINNIPKEILVKYSPLLTNGATLKIGDYPKASVFSDVEYLWIALNTWETSGEKEADKLLYRYQHFITPEFRNTLKKKYQVIPMDRVRLPHAVPGQIFESDKRVVKVGNNAWTVYIDITMHEEYLGQTVKDATYRYAFQVERYETNLEFNPLGIRIVGFKEDPQRIKG